MVGERVGTVGDSGDFGTGKPLRVVVNLLDVNGHRFGSVTIEEICELALSPVAGGDLCAEIAQHLFREANVLADDVPDRAVGFTAIVEFEDRNAKPLLVDLRRAKGVTSGNDAADVDVVRDRGGPAPQVTRHEDRLDDVDIGKVLATRAIGIVEDVDIVRIDSALVLVDQRPHRIVEAAEVQRGRQTLGECLALRIAEGGRVVHRVADDLGVASAHDDQGHFVRDGVERVLDDFQKNGVDVGMCGAHFSTSMTI